MILLGIDLGKVRTGLALCDEGEILASPLAVITEHNRDRLADKIAEAARENHVRKLIVGLPKNMDGSEGESAQSAREMGELLEARTGLPVEFFDERGTTITAHGYLNETNVRGKKRKAVVDAVAATVILQSYLDGNRSRKEKGGQSPFFVV